jgi:hypothetical protein
LAVVTLAIVAPAQVSANESNVQVSAEQASVNVEQKAQEFIVRLYELYILDDKAGLQNLQNELMAYVATLNLTDQDAFKKAGDECMARVEKIVDKVVDFVDKLAAALTLNDKKAIKSVDKEANKYEKTLSKSDKDIFERLGIAYSTKLASSK